MDERGGTPFDCKRQNISHRCISNWFRTIRHLVRQRHRKPRITHTGHVHHRAFCSISQTPRKRHQLNILRRQKIANENKSSQTNRGQKPPRYVPPFDFAEQTLRRVERAKQAHHYFAPVVPVLYIHTSKEKSRKTLVQQAGQKLAEPGGPPSCRIYFLTVCVARPFPRSYSKW